MRIRRAYELPKLTSKTVKVRVLGGDEDYGAFRMGYHNVDNRLTPLRGFATYQATPLYSCAYAKYFPSLNLSIGISTTGQIYKLSPDLNKSPAYVGLVGTGNPSVFAYEKDGHSVAVAAGKRITIIDSAKYTNNSIAYTMRGAAYYKGRLFAVDSSDNFKIRWSGNDILNWEASIDGSGYIILDSGKGQIFQMAALGDTLVAIREYGLDVIKAYGDPRHFVVATKNYQYITEQISNNPCEVCRNKLFFCSKDSIYCFDGESLQKVTVPEYLNIGNFSKIISFFDRYLWITGFIDDVIYQLEYDLETGSFGLCAPGMKTPFLHKGVFYGWKNDVYYKETDSDVCDIDYEWRSRPLDLGKRSVKTLKSVSSECDAAVNMKVVVDGIEHRVKSGKALCEITGVDFTFIVKGGGTVALLEAEWEVRQ